MSGLTVEDRNALRELARTRPELERMFARARASAMEELLLSGPNVDAGFLRGRARVWTDLLEVVRRPATPLST
jgi:hypothetical protein